MWIFWDPILGGFWLKIDGERVALGMNLKYVAGCLVEGASRDG